MNYTTEAANISAKITRLPVFFTRIADADAGLAFVDVVPGQKAELWPRMRLRRIAEGDD